MNPWLAKLERLYKLELKVLEPLSWVFLLGLRIVWGYFFFLTGKGKLGNLERVAGFFESLHIPFPKLNAVMAGTTEMVGGICLILGLGGRVATIPLVFTMLVAYATAEWDSVAPLLQHHDTTDFLKSDPFLFLYASLVVLFFGPGKISADALIGWLWKKKFGEKPEAAKDAA